MMTFEPTLNFGDVTLNLETSTVAWVNNQVTIRLTFN